MASSETSFDSYNFTYKWTVKDLATRLCNPSELSSPTFNSPPGNKPATQWKVTLFKESIDITQPAPSVHGLYQHQQAAVVKKEEYVSINLECLNFNSQNPTTVASRAPPAMNWFDSTQNSQYFFAPPQARYTSHTTQSLQFQQPCIWPSIQQRISTENQQQNDPGMWVEAHLKVTPYERGQTKVGPVHLSPTTNKTILFSKQVTALQLDPSVFTTHTCCTFEFTIRVWLLDKPVHVDKEQEHLNRSIHVPEFNLGKRLEEDRRNNLFTDVTIVTADKKEFRAHKVILASQSKFFKTRFSSRWMTTRHQYPTHGQSGDRVEMTDVSATVMETMISYMYTGEVSRIETIAMDVLPVAEVYGLEGLRKMCERALAKSLNVENAIDILVRANSYNAQDLKKVCMDYICLNIMLIRKSEGWKKLRETEACRDLCVELLDKITCTN